MPDIAVLDVFLHDQLVGQITHLPDDRNLFSFTQNYINETARPTLSLSFKDAYGTLITRTRMVRTRLLPFFSNLLPEGRMREYLASQAGVHPQREFFLMAALGRDLPGAIKICTSSSQDPLLVHSDDMEKAHLLENGESILHFSLAGIQLKFSAILENGKNLTIPANGVGGSWIVKLPSPTYAHVPENEYAMMELARLVGIDVPKTNLMPLEQISGLPKNIGYIANNAFVIKRFDRTCEGKGIHIEDFAQVFGVFPEKKYQAANYGTIAKVIWTEVGEEGLIEFIRRFVFNAFIGNGDMHLKNWSLIYPDTRKAFLAPAYDFVSTLPYLPNDELALHFVDSKAFSQLDARQFERFATKAQVPLHLVLDTVRETTRKFKDVWHTVYTSELPEAFIEQIALHFEKIPLLTQF